MTLLSKEDRKILRKLLKKLYREGKCDILRNHTKGLLLILCGIV